jgi:hypothetical protein
MKTYVLPEDLKLGLMEYLASRPWREVDTAMHRLQELVEIPAPITPENKLNE